MEQQDQPRQPPQHQDRQPGIESAMTPRPRAEDPAYHGSGKLQGRVALIILKRCTESLLKLRSHEETMPYKYDPAPEPMPAEATHLSPPCCVSTH
jgi:hypothetical protein